MHVSKKAQIFGRKSLFNLETTSALLSLQTLKLSVGLSDDDAIINKKLHEFGMFATYLTKATLWLN